MPTKTITIKKGKRNYTTIFDLYQWYPHRKNPEKGLNPPHLYVKKDEISNHEYSLDYRTWKKIVEAYIDVLRESLIRGDRYVFSSGIGQIQLVKHRPKKRMPYYKDMDRVLPWRINIAWRRVNSRYFGFLNMWRPKPSRRKIINVIRLAYLEDNTIIDRYQTNRVNLVRRKRTHRKMMEERLKNKKTHEALTP